MHLNSLSKKYLPFFLFIIVVISIVTLSDCIGFSVSNNDDLVFYVNAEANGTHLTIQSAIDDAINGTTIYVSEGVYKETLVIKKSISIVGANKYTTVINGGELDHTVKIQESKVLLSNLTIEQSALNKAGIYIHSDVLGTPSECVIQDCILLDNYYGIYCSGLGKTSFVNHIIKNNILIDNYESGIYIGYCSGIDIENNTLKNNKDSGIEMHAAKYVCITKNLIVENGKGCCPQAGIYISHSEYNNFSYNLISNNDDFEIKLVNSIFNVFFANSIKHHKDNIEDNLKNNYWDNGTYGNHWIGYTFEDNNNDGIGDIPYNILQNIVYDYLPLMQQPKSIPSYTEEIIPWSVAIKTNSTGAITVGNNILFYGQLNIPQKKIINWRWEFEDGKFGFTDKIHKVFKSAGTHLVTLSVLSETYSRQKTEVTIIVSDSENETIGFNIILFTCSALIALVIKKIFFYV